MHEALQARTRTNSKYETARSHSSFDYYDQISKTDMIGDPNIFMFGGILTRASVWRAETHDAALNGGVFERVRHHVSLTGGGGGGGIFFKKNIISCICLKNFK